jgi:glycosyltransferase involved in cell wall biosynthesis
MINYLLTRDGRGTSGLLLAAVRKAHPQLVGSRTWKPDADWYLSIPASDLPPHHADRAVVYVNATFLDDAMARILSAAPVVVAHADTIGEWLGRNGFRSPDHVISCGFDVGIRLRDRMPNVFTIGLTGYDNIVAPHGWQDVAGASLEGMQLKGTDLVPAVARLMPTGVVAFRLDRASGRTNLVHSLQALGHIVQVAGSNEPGHFFSEVDCVLVASRTEGGPPEALNALAAGVPVVSTPVGEMTKLCDMLWSAPADAAAWLEQLRTDRQAMFQRRHEFRDRVAGRSRLNCARAIVSVLSQLPDQAPAAPPHPLAARRPPAARVLPAAEPPVARVLPAPEPPAARVLPAAAPPAARATPAARVPTVSPAARVAPTGRRTPARSASRESAATPSTTGSTTIATGQLLSVLMTAWRSQEFLTAAVESACSQHLPDGWELELLLAVDGCPQTLGVAERLTDPRIVVVELAENGGTYRALNTLLQIARGSLIAILDSDDVALPGRFSLQIHALEADPRLAYAGGQILRTDRDLEKHVPFRTLPADPRAAFERGNFCFSAHSALMARRSMYETLGGYDDTRVGGDYDLVLRALAIGMRGTNLPVPVSLRRQHPGQLTAAPATGIKSSLRRAYAAGIDQRWTAYRAGVAPLAIARPARTPIASVTRPGFSGSTLMVMATIPARTAGAQRTVTDFLNQGADRIIVYLNGHGSSAGFPRSERVEYRARPAGTGPAVRLEVDSSAYENVVFVDDDIDYPDDYLAMTRHWLKAYGPGAAISYHVRHWRPGARTYSQRTVIHFTDEVTTPLECGYAGLGVAAMPGYFGRLFTQPRPPIFDMNDDLWFSSVLGAAGVSIIRPPSTRGWIRARPDTGGLSLYRAARAGGFAEREHALRYLRGTLGWVPKPMTERR